MSAAQSSVSQWCSDELHGLLGFTSATMTEYVLALGRTSKSHEEFCKKLVDAGVNDINKAKAFAERLLARVPRKKSVNASVSKSTSRSVSNAAELERSSKYSLVLSSEDESTHQFDSVRRKKKSKVKSKSSKSSKRKKEKVQNDGQEFDSKSISKKKRKRRKKFRQKDVDNSSSGDEVSINRRQRIMETLPVEEETEEARDQRERQEFEERLRARDVSKTRHLADKTDYENDQMKTNKPSDKANSTRDGMTQSEQRRNLKRLRELARRKYLGEREKKQLDLLEFQVKDEDFLFSGQKLTKKELELHEKNKQLLDIATNRIKKIGPVNDDYHIPGNESDNDNKQDMKSKEALLEARYVEPTYTEVKSIQQTWEEDRAKGASFTFGSKSKISKENKYEFVIDDSIDFISGTTANNNKNTIKPGSKEDLENQKQMKKKKSMALSEVRKTLPIYGYRNELLDTIKNNQIVIVVGETGSGKTTQIPQYLHEAGYTKKGTKEKAAIKVGCTQPRRVAAMSVAARVAQEVGVKIGNEVGYSIRFEDCTSPKTILKYMTDGMLLREFLTSPDLETYSAIMVDEAHERTLHTDVLFGLVKDIARFREDIRLVISSATMDAEKFSEYFDDAPIFVIPGRMYPIDTLYCKAPEADYIDAAVVTALQAHISQPVPGDILIFMTGQLEIETAEQMLRARTEALGSKIRELIICPIYASLPSEKQALVFQPAPPEGRKVVLATNIAETSLTIDGVTFVIDTGFCKQNSYNPRTGMESLLVTPISKAAANQRSGRAGRTGPGTCFRLFTAWSYKHELEDNTVPEIQRTNLSSVVLMLKSLGINDLMNFDFMDPPPAETLMMAFESLYALGAINSKGELTKMGRRMAEFPCAPQLSKMILASEKFGCVEEILTICAMLDVNNSIFLRPKEKKVHADNARMAFARGNHGDHIALLRVYQGWEESGFSRPWCFENYVQEKTMKRARDIREQLLGLCSRVEIEVVGNSKEGMDDILKAITAGFFYHTAKLQKSGSYRTVKHGHSVNIHPSSSFFKQETLPTWLLYHELVFTTKEFMRQVIQIKSDWLVELAPHYYKPKDLEDPGKKKMPKNKGRVAEAFK